jgi:hypothetical protein
MKNIIKFIKRNWGTIILIFEFVWFLKFFPTGKNLYFESFIAWFMVFTWIYGLTLLFVLLLIGGHFYIKIEGFIPTLLKTLKKKKSE